MKHALVTLLGIVLVSGIATAGAQTAQLSRVMRDKLSHSQQLVEDIDPENLAGAPPAAAVRRSHPHWASERPDTRPGTSYVTESASENNSVLAVAVIARTPGCFSRRSAEIA